VDVHSIEQRVDVVTWQSLAPERTLPRAPIEQRVDRRKTLPSDIGNTAWHWKHLLNTHGSKAGLGWRGGTLVWGGGVGSGGMDCRGALAEPRGNNLNRCVC
jgi:hypothetical protein